MYSRRRCSAVQFRRTTSRQLKKGVAGMLYKRVRWLLSGSRHQGNPSSMVPIIRLTLPKWRSRWLPPWPSRKGFMDANPVLLEPIASVKVVVPDKFTGDVMGDLNRRRGRVLGMNSNHHGKQIIEADIPMSEMFGYNTDLRSMTGGIGVFSYEFSRYEQAPGDIQKKGSRGQSSQDRHAGRIIPMETRRQISRICWAYTTFLAVFYRSAASSWRAA